LFAFFKRRGLQGLGALLESKVLTNADKDKLLQALAKNTRLILPISLTALQQETGNKEQVAASLTGDDISPLHTAYIDITPSERPAGFFIIRAFKRSYEEENGRI